MSASPILAATTAATATAAELAATLVVRAPMPTSDTAASYSITLATGPAEIEAAQRLRHDVFAGEMGARLHSPTPGLDIDEFDAICDHLVVRDDRTGATVGTYRMLPPHAPTITTTATTTTATTTTATTATGRRFYAETEFDMSALAPLRDALVETGRSCVHPDHRNGAVINLMWAGIARYLHLHGYRWLAGCASVPLADGGAAVDAVWALAQDRHLSPPRLRVAPHTPAPVGVPASTRRSDLLAAVPPLLRGYLRLGAWVCGPPAFDADFNVADFFVLLSLDRVDPRYLRHFLGEPGAGPAPR